MATVDMRAALVTIAMDTDPPEVTITSAERAVYPDDLDFLICSDKPIADRAYTFVDDAWQLVRLGFESLDDRTDRVLVPSLGLAAGQGALVISIMDEVGNETHLSHTVQVVAPSPYDVALGMQPVYVPVSEYFEIYVMDVSTECSLLVAVASLPVYVVEGRCEPVYLLALATSEG